MNLPYKSKLSALRRHLPLHSIIRLQQLNLYSTKTTHSSPNSQRLTDSQNQKSSETSSSFSNRIKNPTGEKIVWPKPREIPFQAKISNFVNLIGYVKTPVHFVAASDFAAILISQEISGGKDSLLIPVVFEGDLAHVVANHVKENNCVFVSGQLSTEPMRVALSYCLGMFHVVAQNLCFVERFKRNLFEKNFGVSFAGVEIEKFGDRKIVDAIKGDDDDDDDDDEVDQQWRDALEHAKVKRFSGEKDWVNPQLNGDSEATKLDFVECNPEKCNEVNGEGSNKKKDWELSSVNQQLNGDSEATMLEFVERKTKKCNEDNGEGANKKKDGDRALDLWRDLVRNSLLWWDYRDHKSKGLVKEKFPDFKHKATRDGLWISSAPMWVLPQLGKLEFDVKVVRTKNGQGGKGPSERKKDGGEEDSWKNLVENPGKWWDNRLHKRSPNAPDFKHKETGKGLWVDKSPAWALSRLPPLKNG